MKMVVGTIVVGCVFSFASVVAAQGQGQPKQDAVGWGATTNTVPKRTVVKLRGSRNDVFCEKHSETLERKPRAGQPRRQARFEAVYEAETGFVAWTLRDERIESDWTENLWLIPKVGFVRVSATAIGIRLEHFSTQTKKFSEWKKGKLARFRIREQNAVPYVDIRVSLREHLGADFFSIPGHAAAPLIRIESVMAKDDLVEIELLSAVSGDKAVIWLNSVFDVLRVSKAGVQVYQSGD